MEERVRDVIEPRLLSAENAAAYCGISATLFRRECLLRPIRIGARVLWDRQALDLWIDAIAREQGRVANNAYRVQDPTDEAIKQLAIHAAQKKEERAKRRAARKGKPW